MRVRLRSPLSPRPAFTLVELIVVIVIIISLAALTILLFPRLQDSQRVNKGVDVVQGQLFLAKQLALRDQLPRGVRLIPDPGDNLVHSLQLIEQPLPFILPNSQVTNVTGSAVVITAPLGTTAPINFPSGAVQAGDYLDLRPGNDQYTTTNPHALHYITGVATTAGSMAVKATMTLTLASAPSGVTTPCNYSIVRSPRPMIGINPVLLPDAVVVDYPSAPSHPAPVPTVAAGQPQVGSLNLPASGTLDIVFAPSGKVLGAAGANGKIVLWVYDQTTGWTYNPLTGKSVAAVSTSAGTPEQVLVSVYTQTGSISAQPVNVAAADPYSFVKDGNTSGM
jgi:type II secretory pathway pseudopilin PulG